MDTFEKTLVEIAPITHHLHNDGLLLILRLHFLPLFLSYAKRLTTTPSSRIAGAKTTEAHFAFLSELLIQFASFLLQLACSFSFLFLNFPS